MADQPLTTERRACDPGPDCAASVGGALETAPTRPAQLSGSALGNDEGRPTQTTEGVPHVATPPEPWYYIEARKVMDTITSFGWEVIWRHPKQIPDDAWPIDIIAEAIRRSWDGESHG